MTAISTESLNIKRLSDLPPSAMRKLTPEEIAAFREMIAPPVPPEGVRADNHPDNTYATVKKNGKVVATLYNSGLVTGNLPVLLENLPGFGHDETGSGPQLAQKRAETIAKAIGGAIVKAPTALRPGQWTPRPAHDALDTTAAALVQAQQIRDEAWGAR